MSYAALALKQINFSVKTFFRNRGAVIFTVGFPVMFLLIFAAMFNDQSADFGGQAVKFITWFLPGIVAYGVIGATFVNLSISLTYQRESGVLKRVRGTPLPPWVFIVGQIGKSVVITIISVVAVVVAGKIFFDVQLPSGTNLPEFFLVAIVGAAVFCSLGVAITAFMKDENSAPALANIIILPLAFVSGIFVQTGSIPDWLDSIADVFPVKHLAEALRITFLSAGKAEDLTTNLLVLGAWGLGGLIVASLAFKWEPQKGE